MNIVERRLESLQDITLGQFGEPPVHRIAQPQFAFLDQDHRRNSDNRLGHRRDAEDRIEPVLATWVIRSKIRDLRRSDFSLRSNFSLAGDAG